MSPPLRHQPRPRTGARSAAARVGGWLAWAQARAATAVTARRGDDRGATAIEWAIFALLAILIAGTVAGAITAAVNNRIPGIK
jgi:Flp pilus assembly protein TadG